MKGETFVNAAMVVLVTCAVVITGMVVRREFFADRAAAAPPPVTVVEGWREFARGGHRMGPDAAPVSVVVFSDFQCPYCALTVGSLHELRARHPRDVAIIYHHHPLPSHRYAVAAARASECAADQGRFEAFHDAAFAMQDSIGAVPWTRIAARAGVPDTASFAACADRGAPLDVLRRDAEAGDRLGVTGTPTILVNQYRFRGAAPIDTLDAYVVRALRSAREAGRAAG